MGGGRGVLRHRAKQSADQLVGLKYNTCCWAVTTGYERKITDWNASNNTSVYDNRVSFNVELRGLSSDHSLGSAEMLRSGILPYQRILTLCNTLKTRTFTRICGLHNEMYEELENAYSQLVVCANAAFAAPQEVDKVAAVVDNGVVLESDVNGLLQSVSSTPSRPANSCRTTRRCAIRSSNA